MARFSAVDTAPLRIVEKYCSRRDWNVMKNTAIKSPRNTVQMRIDPCLSRITRMKLKTNDYRLLAMVYKNGLFANKKTARIASSGLRLSELLSSRSFSSRSSWSSSFSCSSWSFNSWSSWSFNSWSSWSFNSRSSSFSSSSWSFSSWSFSSNFITSNECE